MGRHAALQKRAVWEGRIPKTDSGLTKSQLTVSKSGQIVSKLKQAHGKKMMADLKKRGLWAPPFGSRA
jgi:hypothetical protein